MTDVVIVDDVSLSDDDIQTLDEDLKTLGVEVEKPENTEIEDDKPEADDSHDEDHSEQGEDTSEFEGKTDEEREVIRERRRKERQQKRQWRKDKEEKQIREIDSLRRQLAEVNEWKNSVQRNTVSSNVAQLDKAIGDAEQTLNLARSAIKEATETGDGSALVDAQELYYAARKRSEDLGRLKQQIVHKMSAPQQQNIDPRVVNQAKAWMESKTWYDPSGNDEDSFLTVQIDNRLAAEGWDPRTQEYWQELDTRLKKYLPHRFTSSADNANISSGSNKKRSPPTGGSSQEARPSGNQYRLSPDRVKAMKEAGMWDDPEKRQKMIKRYMEADKNQSKKEY